jgi:hypothetical protein
MRQFMLILRENPQDFAQVTPDEMQRIIERYSAWSEALAGRGRLVDGIKLQEEGGRVMSRTGGKTRVTDAAYAEAKEVIGGVFIIRAEDYDEAVQLAEDCPHLEHGTISVREVHDLSGARAE